MKKILMLLMLFVAAAVSAQDTLQLDLETSLRLALEHNNDVKIARLDKDKADEQVDEAWGSALFPKISGNVDYTRAIKRSEFIIETPFFSGSFPVGSENTLTIGASLEQPLFTGAVFLAVRIARTYADISDQIYSGTKSEMVVNVKRAYYTVLLSREVLELTKASLNLAENNLSNTEKMYEAGLVPEYDFIRARVQVQNLVPELQQAENSYHISKNLLRLVTGIPRTQEIKIKDSLTLKEQEALAIENAVNKLLQNNATLKQLQLQTSLQDDVVSYEFSKHFPELYFTGNWQSQAQENDDRSFNSWRYKNSMFVGLNLRVPIFNGFQTTSKVQQAEIDLNKIKEEYDKAVKAMMNQTEEVIRNINQTEKQLEAYRLTIKEAQLGYEIAEKRYSSGVGTQLEVVDALVSLTRAQVNYFSSIYDYYIYHAQLDQLLNTQPESLIK